MKQSDVHEQLVSEAQDAILKVMAYRALRSDIPMVGLDFIETARMMTLGEYGGRQREQLEPVYQEMQEQLNVNKAA